jgi:3',5'-cyclic AMP phosphodiesterase CpdA
MGSPIRFLHLADLHLLPCPNGGHCTLKPRACHVCIKKEILARLGEWIIQPATRPDLLLLGGDLTELRDGHPDVPSWTAPLDKLVRIARAQGIVVAGVTGEHDGENSTARLQSEL